MDAFVQNWYASQLCAMGEPHLAIDRKRAGRTLRFLWLRTFDPGISIHVRHAQGETELSWVRLQGAGGYAPGAVAERGSRKLSSEESRSIDEFLVDSRFWSLATTDRSNAGLDGSQWIVEVVDRDRRHVVDRWNGGELEPIGIRMLDLTGLEADRIY